jgi:hypothetical protein
VDCTRTVIRAWRYIFRQLDLAYPPLFDSFDCASHLADGTSIGAKRCGPPHGSAVVPEVKGRYITWLASPLAAISSAGQAIRLTAQRLPGRRARRNAEIAVGQFDEDVVAVGSGAVAGLSDQCGRAHAVDQTRRSRRIGLGHKSL